MRWLIVTIVFSLRWIALLLFHPEMTHFYFVLSLNNILLHVYCFTLSALLLFCIILRGFTILFPLEMGHSYFFFTLRWSTFNLFIYYFSSPWSVSIILILFHPEMSHRFHILLQILMYLTHGAYLLLVNFNKRHPSN